MGFRESFEFHNSYVLFPVLSFFIGVDAIVKNYNVVASAVGLLMIVFGFVLPLMAYYEVDLEEVRSP